MLIVTLCLSSIELYIQNVNIDTYEQSHYFITNKLTFNTFSVNVSNSITYKFIIISMFVVEINLVLFAFYVYITFIQFIIVNY